MIEPDQLGDHASHRCAGDVRPVDPVGVEHGDAVGGHVGERVVGLARRTGSGAAGVAVVVADDEASAVGEPLAEVYFPHEHGRAGAHDQQDAGIGGIAEGVAADLDAVSFDDSLGVVCGHVAASVGSWCYCNAPDATSSMTRSSE